MPGQVVQDERGVASPLPDACEGQSELLLFDVAGGGVASTVCDSQAVELRLVVRTQGEWAVGEGGGRGIYTSDGFSTRIP